MAPHMTVARFAKLEIINIVYYMICDTFRDEYLLLICPALHVLIRFLSHQLLSLVHTHTNRVLAMVLTLLSYTHLLLSLPVDNAI